ncbi:MAG: hypothetical protein KDC95_13180 [Planctomycetes bacterium]|nr:hypothetical protein [Planctomycetota bacterium]
MIRSITRRQLDLARLTSLVLVSTLMLACGTTDENEPPVQPASAKREVAPQEPAQHEPRETTSTGTDSWTTYRHASGTEFRHPQDWNVQESPDGLRLLPSGCDPERDFILATARPAAGLTDVMSTIAGQRLDQLVRMSLPFLQRTKPPRPLETPHIKGAVYDYSGMGPDGTKIRARSWITIARGSIGGFSLVTVDARFETYVGTVEKIFETLKSTNRAETASPNSTIDQRLVGRFRGESIHSGSGTYSNTQLVWAFNSDGTVLYGSKMHMSASKRDYNGDLEWTASGSSDGSLQKGVWSAQNGIAEIRWQGGTTSRFAYGFEPDGTLAVRDARTRKLINIYTRMQ